jgi:hypothetical protein
LDQDLVQFQHHSYSAVVVYHSEDIHTKILQKNTINDKLLFLTAKFLSLLNIRNAVTISSCAKPISFNDCIAYERYK